MLRQRGGGDRESIPQDRARRTAVCTEAVLPRIDRWVRVGLRIDTKLQAGLREE